jgi:hypothetical protein
MNTFSVSIVLKIWSCNIEFYKGASLSFFLGSLDILEIPKTQMPNFNKKANTKLKLESWRNVGCFCPFKHVSSVCTRFVNIQRNSWGGGGGLLFPSYPPVILVLAGGLMIHIWSHRFLFGTPPHSTSPLTLLRLYSTHISASLLSLSPSTSHSI